MVPAHLTNQLPGDGSGSSNSRPSNGESSRQQLQQHITAQAVPISVTTASHPAPPSGLKRPRDSSNSSSNDATNQSISSNNSHKQPKTSLAQVPLMSKLSSRPSIVAPVISHATSLLAASTNRPAAATGGAATNALLLQATSGTSASLGEQQHVSDQLNSSYSAACSASIRAQFDRSASDKGGSGGGIEVDCLPRATSTQSLPSSTCSTSASASASVAAPAPVEPAGTTALKVMKSANSQELSQRNRQEQEQQEQNKKQEEEEVKRNNSMQRSLSCPTVITTMNPQTYLDSILKTRGYDTNNYCSLESGYYCKPTPHQKASYGIKLIQAVRTKDSKLLASLLRAGLSRNPCNAFGESIVHMVCRRGEMDLLRVLVDSGTSLQVSDDFGRTPLHDACWTAEPNFDVVDLILRTDPRLLRICDCRGASPLSYIKRDNWMGWVDYLNSRKDEFWPARDVKVDGMEGPPTLVGEAPHTRPVPDPDDAAPLDLVTMVASGRLGPEEARLKRDALKKKQQQQQTRSGDSGIEAISPAPIAAA